MNRQEQQVKERWFFNVISNRVSKGFIDVEGNDWIEITAKEKAYIEAKHEGYELRETDGSDDFISFAETTPWALLCIRWVKVPVKQEPKFIEYVISKNIDEEYICDVEHREQVKMLYELPSIVGFAGVKFEGQKSAEWCMFTTAFVTDKGVPCAWTLNDDGTQVANVPATPIAAMFYIKGEK